MREYVVERIVAFLSALPPELIVMFISCFPIIELRGALPIAVSLYGLPIWEAYLLSVIGNMLPVIPLLLLFQPISQFFMKYSWYQAMYNWLFQRTMKKGKNLEKYGALGLILFTAIPIPTTGAWTACFAATFFQIRLIYAFLSIFVGVIIAGFIMLGFSYSIF